VPLQRYKLTIAYRGTRYHGWQRQITPPTWKGETPELGQGIPTVQETLQTALAEVLGHSVVLSGSSRTDAGVHAKGQVAHLDTDQTQIPPQGLRMAVNARLPGDILVRAIEPVDPAFDAVRSTISKRYQYFIWNSGDRPVFFADLAWHRWQRLDIPAMSRAAAEFVGEHDFASFAKPGHGRESTVRRVLSCEVRARGPRVVIAVEGNGFLWNQVRIMVGTIVQVGLGNLSADDIAPMLQARDRRQSGPTAPAHGLFLQRIHYAPPTVGSRAFAEYDSSPT